MEKLKSFLKEHWMPVSFLLLILIICILELRRRKIESAYCPNNCCDCGPGGIAGGVKAAELNFAQPELKPVGKPSNYRKYFIADKVEQDAMSNANIADTLQKFKSIFDTDEEICNIGKLIQKGNEKKILIMGTNVTHTMEFNPRRVIVEEMHGKCIGMGCQAMYAVKSIG